MYLSFNFFFFFFFFFARVGFFFLSLAWLERKDTANPPKSQAPQAFQDNQSIQPRTVVYGMYVREFLTRRG